jgi:hypothetical protein
LGCVAVWLLSRWCRGGVVAALGLPTMASSHSSAASTWLSGSCPELLSIDRQSMPLAAFAVI